MDLFNEYYSSEIQCLLNLFSLNRPFTAAEAEEWVREAHVYSLSGNCRDVLRRWTACGLLRLGEDGRYTVGKAFEPFAAPLNVLETERLRDLCGGAAAALFLPDALREKMDRLLLAERPVCDGEMTPEKLPEAEPFRTVLDAVAKGRRIGYSYSVGGEERYAEVSPWRIEYNALDGRWWLISFWEEQERTVKSRLDRLRDVRMLERRSVSEETIHEAIIQRLAPEPVVLRIAGEDRGKLRNVVERCFIGFENMLETTAVMLSETEYELSFRYFRWDDRLIIRKLLALGEYVTILSPESMVKLMTDDLCTSLMRYQSG